MDFLFVHFKGSRAVVPLQMDLVCQRLAEAESLFSSNKLDVEFAITQDDRFYFLQIRPLCMKIEMVDQTLQKEVLDKIYKKFQAADRPAPFLYGKKAVFGVMPDWNPAEMIGIHPKELAMSLYKEIITDNVWAYQRHNYGYKNLRSFPLMLDFAGMPYIDVRVSFNSFIPADLEENLAEKLTNYYLDRLIENPYKHDKVEFEIIFSCYTLDVPERIEVLSKYGFDKHEIKMILDSLKSLTNEITNSKTGLWIKDYDKISVLEKRREIILQSEMSIVEKIYWLLEDCKRYGTLPFAGLARAAFIAMQILKSLVSKEIINKTEYSNFLSSLNTISSILKNDFACMSRKAFLAKYGHLRPGTYDITSYRYDEKPELYFQWDNVHDVKMDDMEYVDARQDKFKLSLSQLKQIRKVLIEHGLTDDVLGLFDFIKFAIEGREYAKFVFTRNLSDVLQLFTMLGKENGISREECAFCNINLIKVLYSEVVDEKTLFRNSVKQGKEKHARSLSIILPPLITDKTNIFDFFVPDTVPNYVGTTRISGNTYFLQNQIIEKFALKNLIILIPAADPGFDWIFSHGIRGFITEYGGANSHMAIRAAELGIPAVIGVGSKVFGSLLKANVIEIDTLAKKVCILQ